MAANDLKDFRWEQRLILLQDPEITDFDALRAAEFNILERDIFWFALDPDHTVVTSNYTGGISSQLKDSVKAYFSTDSTDRVLLIGKDGGVKAREQTLDLPELFRLIDSMPMRQAEMRR